MMTAIAHKAAVPGAYARQPMISIQSASTIEPPINTVQRPNLSKANPLMTMKITASMKPPAPTSEQSTGFRPARMRK
jgi:hypothetical protein